MQPILYNKRQENARTILRNFTDLYFDTSLICLIEKDPTTNEFVSGLSITRFRSMQIRIILM